MGDSANSGRLGGPEQIRSAKVDIWSTDDTQSRERFSYWRDAVCRAVRLWSHATSLGGTESTLERRGRYDLDAPHCAPGFLRLSVGIEDAGDLWTDLDAALAATRPGGAGPRRAPS